MLPARSRPTSRIAALVAVLAIALFTVGGTGGASAEKSFTFRGGGWGHGVGMSQYGACGMAAGGSSFQSILGHYYSGTTTESRSEPAGLRVMLADSNTITITTAGTTTIWGYGNVGAGLVITASRSGNKVVLSGSVNATIAAPLAISQYGSAMRVSPPGQRFDRGHLVIKPTPGSSTQLRAVIEQLSARDYLLGLGEMPASWPSEALKSQAVAGRTIALTHSGSSGDHDLRADRDGAYIGYDMAALSGATYFAKWTAAVDATAGTVITHGGTPIASALYYSSSGGHTENSENVWFSSLPYLRAVPDPADSGCNNTNNSWTATFGAAQLGQKLGMGSVTAVSIRAGVTASGRLDKASLTFTDSGGVQRSFTGAQLRTKLGLRSTKFVIDGVAVDTSGTGLPKGGITDVRVQDRRKILVAGTASDPDGAPRVFIATVHNGKTRWRVTQSVNGYYLDVFAAEPGKHTTCVAALDTPSGAATTLGCRETIVK